MLEGIPLRPDNRRYAALYSFIKVNEYKRSWLLGVLLAVLLTILVNIPGLTTLLSTGTYYLFEVAAVNEDQLYYLSRLREVFDGFPLIGNSSLKDHRSLVSPNGFVEWIPTSVGAILNLSVKELVITTNILFPFLLFLLTFLWLKGLLNNAALALAGTAASWLSMYEFFGILRESSPKTTMLLPSMYLCLLFIPKKQYQWTLILRGLLLGCMIYTYHYHWSLLFVFEGFYSLYLLMSKKRFWPAFKTSLWVWVPFFCLAIPYVLNGIHNAGDPISAEMWRRFGVIPTRMIAAPVLQAKILTWLIPLCALWTIRWFKRDQEKYIVLLVVASLIAVNSNLITGVEAEFEGHYGRFIRFFLWGSFLLCARHVFTQSKQLLLAGIITITSIIAIVGELPQHIAYAHNNAALWNQEQYTSTMQWIETSTTPESVILAPFVLSSRIPVYTDNYVWFNYGSRSFRVSEAELIERYNVQITFYPEDIFPVARGAMPVFGNFGVLYSKQRTQHNLLHLFRTPFPYTMPDFIVNQEHRKLVERIEKEPDITMALSALKTYEIDYVVTDKSIPNALSNQFSRTGEQGKWVLWRKN